MKLQVKNNDNFLSQTGEQTKTHNSNKVLSGKDVSGLYAQLDQANKELQNFRDAAENGDY
jgi:hypothetical protein